MVGLAIGPSLAAPIATPENGMIAHWDFAQPSAPFIDRENGFELALAPTATAPTRNADGFQPGTASLAFDGSDQHLQIAPSDLGALQIGGRSSAVTVGAWVKRAGDTNAAIAGIWPEDAQAPQRQYALFLNLALYGGDDRVCGHVSADGQVTPGYPYMRDYSWNARRLSPGGSDGWRFAVFTYDGVEIRSYLDGSFERVPSYTDIQGVTGPANPRPYASGLNPTPAEFTVGAVRLSGGYGNFLDGEIAHLRVWDRALSQAEIQRLYLTERPSGQPLFIDHFRTDAKVASRHLGWRSFQGANCLETTDTAPDTTTPDIYNFAGGPAGNGGYLARSASATGIGAAFFDGFWQAPLHWADGLTMRWVMNNSDPSDTVRVILRTDGQWYASSAAFQCTEPHTASHWTNAELFEAPLTRIAADWHLVTLEPGVALSLDASAASDLMGSDLQAFGFLAESGSVGTIRIDDLRLETS